MRHISSIRTIRFTTSARKHRIGKAHALHLMGSVPPLVLPATETVPETWTWVGPDDRGLELEVIARRLTAEQLLVIHVMPLAFRRKR